MLYPTIMHGTSALFALLLGACGSSEGGTAGPATSSSTTESTTSTTSTTATPTTSGTTSTAGATSTTDAGMTTTSVGFIPESTGGEQRENGETCGDDEQCASLNCYPIGFAGTAICAVCDADSDCMAAGTGLSCTFNFETLEATCEPGDPGDDCMTAAACKDGLFCDAVAGPSLPRSCGECSSDSDCPMGELCTPVGEGGLSFSAHNICVEPASVPEGELCPYGGQGSTVCASGHCNDTSDLLTVAVCGECTNDMDCRMDQACTPGKLEKGVTTGSTCG